MMHLYDSIWTQFSMLRILMSRINVFQGQILSIHAIFLKVQLCFPQFFPFWVSQTCFSQDGIYR